MAEELKRIGAQMANVMFNLAQRAGEPLDGDVVAIMDKLRKQWDAALRATPPSPSTAEDEIDIRFEFERWMSQRGEATTYIGDGLYSSGAVCDQAEAFAAGVAIGRAALSANAADREAKARDAARYRWIEDNARTNGGGQGFTVFVSVDEEDLGCGIDAAMKLAGFGLETDKERS